MSFNKEYSLEKIILKLKQTKNLQKAGKFKKALICLEKLKEHSQNFKFLQIKTIIKRIILISNALYISNSLKAPYLRKAESAILFWQEYLHTQHIQIDEKIIKIAMITYNNWAFFHKSNKDYYLALSYFEKALCLCKEFILKDPDSYDLLAKTHLNISILYSELHKYDVSINSSNHCLEILQTELKLRSAKGKFIKMCETDQKKFKDMISTYVLAFYSIALANEAQHHINAMKTALQNAVDIGSKYLDSSNQIYLTVIRALAESDKKKALHKSAIDPALDESKNSNNSQSEFYSKPRIFQLSLSVPTSEINLSHHEKAFSPNPSEKKIPGRYYSNSELEKKVNSIKEVKSLNFISADTYFFKEISKGMDVSSDFKYMKPLDSNDSKMLIKQENSEKRVICDLRFKRKHRGHSLNVPVPDLRDKLQVLKQAEQEISNNQRNKINGIVNSLESKNLIRSLCDRNKKKRFPDQSN